MLELVSANKKLSVFLVFCLFFGIYWFSSIENDKQQILATLEEVRVLYQVEGKKLHPIEAAQQAKELTSYFSESIELRIELSDVDHLRIIGQEELRKHSLAIKTQLKTLELNIKDIELQEIVNKKAALELTAAALGSMPGEKGQFFELHRLKIQMRYEDSRWKIEKVSHIKNLRE